MEIIQGIFSEAFWYIAPILVSATTFLSGLVNQSLSHIWNIPGWAKQLISWVIGSALSCAAWGLGVITFGSSTWVGVVALCAVVGLSSNGVYDISFIKNMIEKWFVPATAKKAVATQKKDDPETSKTEE